MKRILAIDFGFKRIGLALSDPLLTFAYPYKTLINDQTLHRELKKILEEKEVTEIVLGIPLQDREEKSEVVKAIERFKKTLEKKYALPVSLWDESYSSVMAKKRVLESTPKKSARRDKGLIDKNAAALLLQEYLERIQ